MDSKPKKLYFDLETTARKGDFWGNKWETSIIEIIQHTKILSFSAKWDGGKCINKGWIDYKGYKPGKDKEKQLLQELWELLNEADIVVAQNGKKFDIRVANARFAYHGFKPYSPIKLVDPRLEAKKILDLPSYSLDDMAAFFGIGRKIRHRGYDLWKDCVAGDKSAWKDMKTYNAHDVWLMEQVYLRLLPYMKSHPNIGMFTDKIVCPNCGSGKIHARGFAITKTMKYRRVQCQNCGTWSRYVNAEDRNKPIVAI